MGATPSALRSLARKYRALRDLRRGQREFDALEARALAREFPGALRELDVLSLERIDARLAEVTLAEDGGQLEPWIEPMLAYHARMRQLLAAKQRLAGQRQPAAALSASIARALSEQFAVPIDQGLIARVADPPQGRLNQLVFELMAGDLGLAAGSIEHVLFPRFGAGRSTARVTSLALRTWDSIRAIGASRLASLDVAGAAPFVCYEWLDALEATGCVSEERGWRPLHLTLHRGERLVAFAPAYLKGNSEGEFVFDHSFARFAETSLKIPYYPKLLVAVPFTPASGSRLLLAPGEDRGELSRAFVNGLGVLCEKLELSSAHVLFPSAGEASHLVEAGLARRTGVQFHWQNRDYAGFDDFLGQFNAKRRHQIRRERREVAAQGIDVDVLTGSDLGPELADFVHAFYRTTVDKFFWGRRYLNREFFEEVLARLRDRIHLVVAKDRGSGRRIAGAFNLLSGDTLYGRYWGALEDRNFLHFEVCFYRGIEDAISRGLRRFEPGAGGEHKLSRGFEPAPTFSAHHFADPRFDRVARDFMGREERALDQEIREARQASGLRAADESAEGSA